MEAATEHRKVGLAGLPRGNSTLSRTSRAYGALAGGVHRAFETHIPNGTHGSVALAISSLRWRLADQVAFPPLTADELVHAPALPPRPSGVITATQPKFVLILDVASGDLFACRAVFDGDKLVALLANAAALREAYWIRGEDTDTHVATHLEVSAGTSAAVREANDALARLTNKECTPYDFYNVDAAASTFRRVLAARGTATSAAAIYEAAAAHLAIKAVIVLPWVTVHNVYPLPLWAVDMAALDRRGVSCPSPADANLVCVWGVHTAMPTQDDNSCARCANPCALDLCGKAIAGNLGVHCVRPQDVVPPKPLPKKRKTTASALPVQPDFAHTPENARKELGVWVPLVGETYKGQPAWASWDSPRGAEARAAAPHWLAEVLAEAPAPAPAPAATTTTTGGTLHAGDAGQATAPEDAAAATDEPTDEPALPAQRVRRVTLDVNVMADKLVTLSQGLGVTLPPEAQSWLQHYAEDVTEDVTGAHAHAHGHSRAQERAAGDTFMEAVRAFATSVESQRGIVAPRRPSGELRSALTLLDWLDGAVTSSAAAVVAAAGTKRGREEGN